MIKKHKDCNNKCKFGCAKVISEDERESIFLEFDKLSQPMKYSFMTARPKDGPSLYDKWKRNQSLQAVLP